MSVETVVAVVGGIIGAIGGTVGILTAIRSNRRELQREIDEENDFSFLAALMETQLKVGGYAGQIMTEEEIGSVMWKRAEKMVERGVLARGPQGRGYRIRGFEDIKRKPFVRQPEKVAPEIEIDRR